MATFDFNSRSVEDLAEEYARTRRARIRPISVAAAIRAIRTVAPNDARSDRELADLVARQAIFYGHSVDFDHQ